MRHRDRSVGVFLGMTAAAALAGGCGVADGLGSGSSYASTDQIADEVRVLAADNDVTPVEAAPAVSDELFELGRSLAFDKILSGNENISCMTCHHSTVGTDDDRHLPLGEGGTGLGEERVGGHIIPRNAPAMFNLHAMPSMFWDSRVSEGEDGSLTTPAGDEITPEMEAVFDFGAASAQAMFPVTSPHEMRGLPGTNEIADASSLTEVWARLMARLGEIPEYVQMFEAAYPGTDFEDMTFAHAANAIAGFEIRAFEATNSRWQQFLEGDDYAMSRRELRGALDFFESGCASCHNGPMLSDFEHHNTALAQFGPGKGHGKSGADDFGRAGVTGLTADRYAFRTPTLQNIELTAPYGHDGQFADLKTFIDHYDEAADKLERYKIWKHVSETHLWDMQVDNTADVLAYVDPLAEVRLSHLNEVVYFLKTLTTPASRDLDHTVPESVPSGLPVAD